MTEAADAGRWRGRRDAARRDLLRRAVVDGAQGRLAGQPALWFLGSLLLRMGIALAGFYFVAGGDWERLLPCLLGFVVARLVVTWLIGRRERSAAFGAGGPPCALAPTR